MGGELECRMAQLAQFHCHAFQLFRRTRLEAHGRWTRALPTTMADHPAGAPPSAEYERWNDATNMHHEYKRNGRHETLDTAIGIYREILQDNIPHGIAEWKVKVHLAEALHLRFLRNGLRLDFNSALDIARDALSMCPDLPSSLAESRTILGRILADRFLLFSDAADLSDALVLCKDALSALKPSDAQYPQVVYDFSLAENYRMIHERSIEGIPDLVTLLSDTVDMTSHDHVLYPLLLSGLAETKCIHAWAMDITASSDDGVALFRQALEICGTGYYGRDYMEFYLAHELERRSRTREQLEDIQESIDILRNLLLSTEQGNPYTMWFLIALNSTLHARFRRLGDIHDLDDGIYASREAISLASAGLGARYAYFGAEPYMRMEYLAGALLLRYEHMGNSGDLEEGIQLNRQAVALCPVGSPHHSAALNALAEGLQTKMEGSPVLVDVIEIITLSRTIMSLCSPENNHYLRHQALHRIGIALTMRSVLEGTESYLDEAIQIHEQLLAFEHTHPRLRSNYLWGAVDAYCTRYDRLGNAKDALRAGALCDKALSIFPEGHPGHVQAIFEHVRLCANGSLPIDGPYDILVMAMEAITDVSCSASYRLQRTPQMLAAIWQNVHDKKSLWPRLLALYVEALELLPRVAYYGLTPHSRLTSVKKAESLSLDAAALALSCSNTFHALDLLERGRSIFWTQALRLRTGFEDVPDPLRARLLTLTRQLEHDSFEDSVPLPGDDAAGKAKLEQRHAVRRQQSEELESLLEEARTSHGLDLKGFYFTESHSWLGIVAAKGPVVVLLSSSIASSVLIIQHATDPFVIPLAGVTDDWLVESDQIWRGMSLGDDDDTERLAMKKRKFGTSLGENQARLLEALWDKIVRPVILEVLKLQPAVGHARPRLWWIPTSNFLALPIHAAQSRDGRFACCNYVVSSYAPSIHALLHAREGMSGNQPNAMKALLAGSKHGDDAHLSPLQSASQEIQAIRTAMTGLDMIIQTSEEDDITLATLETSTGMCVEAVMKKLPEAHILHLACHGYQNRENPLESGFYLRDGRLTIAKLMPLSLPNAFLAFLSACETAKGDSAQPDQTVHLAAAMLFVGFKSVIATLWSMTDTDGPIVAKAFYEELFKNGTASLNPDHVPYALDAAVQKLRTLHISPARWAPYVHIGV